MRSSTKIWNICAASSLIACRYALKSNLQSENSVNRKVCVLGCGIAGLTTAIYLANDGYEVVCIESRSAEGQESSHLNGSLICPSLTTPWANITTLKYILKSLSKSDRNGPLQTTIIDWNSIGFDWSFFGWLFRFVKSAVVTKDVQSGYNASYQLSLFSKECMRLLYTHENVKYQPGVAVGSLQMFGDPARRAVSLDSAASTMTDMQSLDPSELRAIEPIISTRVGLGGAILNKKDTSGDIGAYCKALRERAESLGVRFHTNSVVTAESFRVKHNTKSKIEYVNVVSTTPQNGIQGSVNTEGGIAWREYADMFVIATGNSANDISEWAGDGVLLWPMKGYALEVPVSADYLDTHGGKILRHLIADDVEKVYIAPLDSRCVRISGIVDIGDRRSYSCRSLRPVFSDAKDNLIDTADSGDIKRGLDLLEKARSLLPPGYLDASDSQDIKIRVCYRPQTADDLPVIGQSSRFSNLYYNCGHGHLGFTRATGSSRILVDIIYRDELMSPRSIDDGPEIGESAAFSCMERTDIIIPRSPETSHLPSINCDVFSPKRLSTYFWK